MTKIKTTNKQLQARFKCFSCGYCELSRLLNGQDPIFYNSGVYGWNYDAYIFGNICITTGYRNTTGKRIPYELTKKYETKVAEAYKNHGYFTQEYKDIKNSLLNEFIKELESL